MEDTIWLEWIAEVMATKPVNNELLESQRGQEVVDLLLDLERADFNWHRGDADTFWIDAQMCIKYQLSNAEIKFLAKQQPGVVNYQKHSKERNAYAEMMRGLQKLKELNFPEIYNHSLSTEEEKKKFEEVFHYLKLKWGCNPRCEVDLISFEVYVNFSISQELYISDLVIGLICIRRVLSNFYSILDCKRFS